MKDILFFSNNKDKIKEICSLLENHPYKILNLNNFEKIVSPSETGTTFEENAKIKSIFGLKKFNKICFADDSGICIEAMNNGPGVNSSDFLNLNKDKKKIFNEIIKKTKDKNCALAYFQTTICFSVNEKENFFFTGKVLGKISDKIRGVRGFGYDPIFIPNGHDLTFAEMSINEKNKISHRGIAISKFKKHLISI